MFSLLLAVIISSAARRSQAAPGLQGSFGFGEGGTSQSYETPSHDYETSHYGHGVQGNDQGLQQSHFGNSYGYRGFSDVYVPKRLNPFSFPYYRSSRSSLNSYQTDDLPLVGYQNAHNPQPVFYQSYKKIADYPYNSVREHSNIPYDKVTEPYTTFDSSNERGQEVKKISSLESGLQINSKKPGQLIQLTYLGHLPPSSFKSTPHDILFRQSHSDSNLPKGIPFYPLNFNNRNSNSFRSSLSPILLSPYRFKTDSPTQIMSSNYPQVNARSSKPIISPYSSKAPDFSQGTRFLNLRPNFSRESSPVVSPNRLEPAAKNTQPFDTSPYSPSSYQNFKYLLPRAQNEYYLIDVQPTAKTEEGHIPNKFEHRNYNTGFETYLPHARSYSKFRTGKGLLNDRFNRGGDRASGRDRNMRRFGPPDIGMLLGPLIMLRNSDSL